MEEAPDAAHPQQADIEQEVAKHLRRASAAADCAPAKKRWRGVCSRRGTSAIEERSFVDLKACTSIITDKTGGIRLPNGRI